jgi:hypothetical protein
MTASIDKPTLQALQDEGKAETLDWVHNEVRCFAQDLFHATFQGWRKTQHEAKTILFEPSFSHAARFLTGLG